MKQEKFSCLIIVRKMKTRVATGTQILSSNVVKRKLVYATNSSLLIPFSSLQPYVVDL